MGKYKEVFGVVKDKVDIRDYYAKLTSANVEFAPEFELEMCAVKNQEDVSSCVAHAIASTIEYFNKVQEGSYTKMSTAYIYGNRTNSTWKGLGMRVTDALDAAREFGTCPNSLLGGNVEIPEAIEIFEENCLRYLPRAYPNRITTYYHLSTDAEIKASLLQNGPVIFSTEWFNGYQATKDNDYVLTKPNNATSAGYHCMVIYGWNEKGWKIQNSWGKGWGNQGKAILPYGTRMDTCFGVIDTYSEHQRELRVTQLEEKIDSLNKVIEEKVCRENELTAEIADYENRIKSLLEKLNTDGEDSESIKEENARLQEKLEELKKELETAKSDINNYTAKISEQENMIDTLNKELIEIKKPNQNTCKLFVKIANWFLNLFH